MVLLFGLSWEGALEQSKERSVIKPVRIVVLGGGFGGIYTTLGLEKGLHRRSDVEITLVNRDNFFLFAPLLHEVATGAIETRHIAIPIRALRGKRNFRFLTAEVNSVDIVNKCVHTDALDLEYDYLVLAMGGVANKNAAISAVPGVYALRTLYDGLYLRNHVIRQLEHADALSQLQAEGVTFVVVGGDAIGVQLVAELRDFVFRNLLKRYRSIHRSRVRFVLVHSRERLLSDMDSKIAAYALSRLQKMGIDVRLNTTVRETSERGIELSSGETLTACTVVWTLGTRANPVVETLPVAKDPYGRVLVDEYLGVPGLSGVYALGDNACCADKRGTPLPPRAHVAVRQPKTVVGNIIAELSNRPRRVFSPPWMADMVSLGSRSAAIRVKGLRLYGFPARVLWLAGFLSLIPKNYNRIRIALDWFLSLIFGRDNTLLRLR